MIRIAVCDDRNDELSNTVSLIKDWLSANNMAAELSSFSDGDSLISKARQTEFDLIFLDIIMPLLNGIDTAREIRRENKSVKIVFLTSSEDFALDSYSVKAVDYCIKPASREKISEILQNCVAEIDSRPAAIILKTQAGYQKIFFHTIEYIEAQGKRVVINLISGESLVSTGCFSSICERLLSEPGFFKCHRSYLVNMENVSEFSLIDIKTLSGASIPIARGFGKPFNEAYFAYMFNQQ